ncbi:GNAT family N-acetyltransferase [Actinoalloteichus fjordicus]|uniref:Acetyltransferase n=1 Tax=Actinoalloteichus fjordicus TaxID=1612552 RepID=A0AAC9LFP0_9PSEU|nr:GNAT family N-acetyltransferase [Actinoalloteichus fjordicus]APU17073.1 acetyltransferase [Actinoalloteichus fjordicus]
MAQRVVDTITAYWALGGSRSAVDGGTVVSHPGIAPHPLGDFLQLSAETGADRLPEVLAAAERRTGRVCSTVRLHPAGRLDVEPRLIIEGWQGDSELQLVCDGPLTVPDGAASEVDVPGLEVRPLREADWPAVARLFRLDHEEEDRAAGVQTRPHEVTDAAVGLRRELSRHADFQVAAAGETVVGFVVSAAGEGGLGIVEDVFVRSDHRRQGIATALIVAAVAQARRRGARELLIAADPDDHPKHLYARLGFRPTLVTWSYSRPAPQTES